MDTFNVVVGIIIFGLLYWLAWELYKPKYSYKIWAFLIKKLDDY